MTVLQAHKVCALARYYHGQVRVRMSGNAQKLYRILALSVLLLGFPRRPLHVCRPYCVYGL